MSDQNNETGDAGEETLSDKRAQAGRLGGAVGGKAVTAEKQSAARENGKKGGRPRTYATATERQRAYLQRKKAKNFE